MYLLSLLSYIPATFYTLIFPLCLSKPNNKNSLKLLFIFSLLICVLVSIINIINIQNNLKQTLLAIFQFFYFIFPSFFFRIKKQYFLVFSFIITMIYALANTAFSYLFYQSNIVFLNINNESLLLHSRIFLIRTFIYIVLTVILYIKIYFIDRKDYQILFTLFSTSSILYIFYVSYIYLNLEFQSRIILFISAILCIILNVGFLYLNPELKFYKNIHNKEKEIELTKMKFYHDTKSHMITIGTLVEEGRNEEALEYLSKFVDVYKNVNKSNICLNPVVNAYLVNVITILNQYNIKYTFNINISDNKNVDDYHIITILSNILKNALKASLTTKNPFVNLEIDNSKNILKIVCANNFNKNKETNLQVKIDNPINFHVGIQNIEDTVNLYNGLYKTEIDDEIYKVIIII